jgi:tetratricopeptide (TPR) repeat protein
MPESQRIEDLRRRVQKDAASIAFAQLAEELRRSGALQEAVDICRAGLAIHPSYLSARVTLGRALIELNELDAAQAELERVLEHAAENLAAIRGLGEVCARRGQFESALKQYQSALALAPNDPDLEDMVSELSEKLVAAALSDAVSFEAEPSDPARDRATRTVAALETWLDAIDVSRSDGRS